MILFNLSGTGAVIDNINKWLLVTLAILLALFPLLGSCAEDKSQETTLPVVQGVEQIRINALRLDRRAPASLEIINADGFNPDGELWVRFFNNKGFSVDCPAIDATSTSITVSVPPFADLKTGKFSSGIVSLQIYQESDNVTLISRAIDGFQIDDLPEAPGTTGEATIVYLNGIVQLIEEEKSNLAKVEQISEGELSCLELINILNELQASYIAIKNDVESVMADPKKSVVFAQIGDDKLELSIESLDEIDRLVTAVEEQAVSDSAIGFVPPIEDVVISCGGLQSEKTQVIFLNWRQEKPAAVLINSEANDKNTYSQAITWGGYAGTMAGWGRFINKNYVKNEKLRTNLARAKIVSSLFWVGTTAIPAAEVFYADFTTQLVANEGKGFWETWMATGPCMERFVTTIASWGFDTFSGVPMFGTMKILSDVILGPDWDRTRGIAIADAVENNLGMQVEFVKTQLSKESGLDYIQGEQSPTPSTPATPPTITPQPWPPQPWPPQRGPRNHGHRSRGHQAHQSHPATNTSHQD